MIRPLFSVFKKEMVQRLAEKIAMSGAWLDRGAA
jgi:hypothetical protein